MKRPRPTALPITIASLTAALAACGSDPPADSAPPDEDHAADPITPPMRAVTLLTGDRVTVHRDGRPSIDPASSRVFHTFQRAGHHHVVPAEAMSLVASGRVDPRLFDVTLLVELGYHDDARGDLPLIVTYGRERSAVGPSALTAAGARMDRPLPAIRGQAVRADKRGAGAVWSAITGGAGRSAAVEKVWLDGKRHMVLDRSAAQVGAPAAWQTGLTGQGVTVAVLDSGIDAAHPDFAGRIADARSFLEDAPEPIDDVGHGTHVASILAGSGAGDGGLHRGIAPDASLLIGKVCDPFDCPESAILAGMAWAAESGASVVNLSLTGPDGPEVDPLEAAIDALTAAHGTLFVVAAGNFGPCGGDDFLRVGSPGTADAALAVGAVGRDDALAEFSCRGPRTGDGAVKPEITAPGIDIAAARAGGIDGEGDPVDDLYTRMSGTSMASPHVAGAAALLVQQHPDWRAAELKAALIGSALENPATDVMAEGAGRLDVTRALAQRVIASPSTLVFEQAVWPHEDDLPSVRTVTYRNHGASPIVLRLSAEARTASGEPAPAAMFTFEPTELTVPAGGEATTTFTVDTRVPGPDGQLGGVVVAASDDQTVRTPFALDKEVESHELEVAFLDRAGAPPTFAHARIVGIASSHDVVLTTEPGANRARLPRGTYHVHAVIEGKEDDQRDYSALLVQPLLELDGELQLQLDARLTAQVSVTVPPASARRAMELVRYGRDLPGRFHDFGILYLGVRDPDDTFGSIYTAHLGPAVSEAELLPAVQSVWAEAGPPDEDVELFTDTPYLYSLTYLLPRGLMPTGFVHQVEDTELAVVHAQYAGEAGTRVQVSALPDPRIPSSGSGGPFLDVRLPGERTEYYTTKDMDWNIVAIETGPGGEMTELATTPAVTYHAGQTYRTRWNGGVLGPDLTFTTEEGRFAAARRGDRIVVRRSYLYSDRGDHTGFSLEESGPTRLFRDGVLLAEQEDSGSFDVPPGPADYRVEIESIRGGDARLSTEIHLAWTFRSERLDDETIVRLPVMTVGFEPRLDLSNRAPGGCLFLVPISVERQHDAPAAALHRLKVQASYDRGGSWHEAPVVRLGLARIALLLHPDAGRASRRAQATDEAGNRVEQTILDAYHIGDPG